VSEQRSETANRDPQADEALVRQRWEQAVREEADRRERAQRDQRQQQRQEQDERARQAAGDLWKRGYDGPPPWEVAQAHGDELHQLKIDTSTREPIATPTPYVGPGAVTHSEPILTTGAADTSTDGAVSRLAALLRDAGYEDNRDPLARAAGVLTNDLMREAHRFAGDHGIGNDVTEWQGRDVAADRLVGDVVGPYIWQGLYHAANRAREERAGAPA
jgi:hypothetical protein